MKTNDILLQSIKTLIQQEIEKAPFNKTKQGIITKNYMDGTYDVRFDGNLYTKILTYPNSTSLQLGQTVKIIIPNNQSSQMYISAEGSPLIYYPVGSYYETSDTSFDPNVTWGGTWELETEGQVHISSGANYVIAGGLTNTSDGGATTSKTQNHTLTIAEIPAHSHSITNWSMSKIYAKGTAYYATAYTSGTSTSTANAGGGGAHNHGSVSTMQPYIVVNRWHRTA